MHFRAFSWLTNRLVYNFSKLSELQRPPQPPRSDLNESQLVFDLQAITIMSGGQTGADRAALDFAIEHGLRHGGWCPRGRLAEDGPLAAKYLLDETSSRLYSQRTEMNVRDADATVVFSIGPKAAGGTALTLAVARRLGKPCLHLCRDAVPRPAMPAAVDTDDFSAVASRSAAELLAFLAAHQIRRLNIAGPRASQEPQIAAFVRQVLEAALRRADRRPHQRIDDPS